MCDNEYLCVVPKYSIDFYDKNNLKDRKTYTYTGLGYMLMISDISYVVVDCVVFWIG